MFYIYKTIRKNVNIIFLNPDYSLCGESTYDLRGRMVGGNKADRGRWPWQIGIHTLGDDGICFVIDVSYIGYS
jgi:hypothetical protein